MKNTIAAFLLLLSVSLPGAGFAQVVPTSKDAEISIGLPVPPNLTAKWAWTKALWGNSRNREVQSESAKIDTAIKEGNDPIKLAAEWKAKWQASPNDINRLTIWTYAAYKSMSQYKADSDSLIRLDRDLIKALEEVPPPYSYEFMRARFLYATKLELNDPTIQLGVRLAQSEPKDFEVHYLLASTISIKPENRPLALKYAKELIRIDPDRPSCYAAVAWIYFAAFFYSGEKTRENAEQAVKYYKKYLDKPQVDAWSREQAVKQVSLLEKWLTENKKTT